MIVQLLLAAGGSSRMGKPKQLLPWKGTSLLMHQIQVRLSLPHPLLVVLGNEAEQLLPMLSHMPIVCTQHANWKEGMGSSIAHGVKFILEQCPTADAVLISLLDQPLVTASYLETLMQAFDPVAKQILVSQDEQGLKSPPALFDRYYFEGLMALKGDLGAKPLIRQYAHQVSTITAKYPLLADMDTPQTYEQLFRELGQ